MTRRPSEWEQRRQPMSVNEKAIGSAQAQAALWGARARDWAEIQEGAVRPLFETVLHALDVRPGTALLDVGCGAGQACALAAELGATVTGFDATPELLAIARER